MKSQKSLPSNRRFTPKKFFPKIFNSKKEFDKKYKKKIKEEGLDKKYSKVNPKALGLTLGIISSITAFFVTIMTISSNNLGTITTILKGSYGWLGYEISIVGAILGAIYVFIDSFIIGYVLAYIYNKFI